MDMVDIISHIWKCRKEMFATPAKLGIINQIIKTKKLTVFTLTGRLPDGSILSFLVHLITPFIHLLFAFFFCKIVTRLIRTDGRLITQESGESGDHCSSRLPRGGSKSDKKI